MLTILIVFYILAIILIISTLINKSYNLSFLIGTTFIIDLLIQLKDHFIVYPKPYIETGFIFFCITTGLYLFIPTLTFLSSIWSWTRKIALYPILAWLSACIFCLWNYPAIRGADMLNLFYAYYLSISVANLIYMLSKAKNRFSFSQIGLMLASVGGILGTILALMNVVIDVSTFRVENWTLVCLSNCIFYMAMIAGSWLNRVLTALRP